MLDYIIDEKKIDQMKIGLVGEFINCLSNVIENKEYNNDEIYKLFNITEKEINKII